MFGRFLDRFRFDLSAGRWSSVGNVRNSRRRKRLTIEACEPRMLLSVGPIITEMMIENDETLVDGFGNTPDWLEIYNPTSEPIDLTGWYLTDYFAQPTRWAFPAAEIDPDGYLIVFASGDDTVDPQGYLHTNFKLGDDDDGLALVAPDGVTVVSQLVLDADPFAHAPSDVSYGKTLETDSAEFVAPGDSAKLLVPQEAVDPNWTGGGAFDDSAWTDVTLGVGYDQSVVAAAPAPAPGLLVAVDRTGGATGNLAARHGSAAYDGETDPIINYNATGLQEGVESHADRDGQIWTNIPDFLIGADYVETFNNDKSTGMTTEQYAVTVIENVVLYIMVDDRAETGFGSWLTDASSGTTFFETGLDLILREGTTDRPFSILAAPVLAGQTITLGDQTGGSIYGIAASSQLWGAVPYLSVDIGPTGQRLALGNVAFQGAAANTNDTAYAADLTAVTGDVINMAVTAVDWRDRGDSTAAGDEVRVGEDFVKNNDGNITVTLSGLPAGEYMVTSYHVDPDNTQCGAIDVYVTDADSDGTTAVGLLGVGKASGSYILNTGVDSLSNRRVDASSAVFPITSNGTDPVVIRFDGTLASDTEVPLNGLLIQNQGMGTGAIGMVTRTGGNDPLDPIVTSNLQEDSLAFADREHQLNGVDASGLPTYLLGADYVRFANDDRTATVGGVTNVVWLNESADVYLMLDNRNAVPQWVIDNGWVDTGDDVGADEVPTDVGPGVSINQTFSVYHQRFTGEGPIGFSLYESGVSGNNNYSLAAVAYHEWAGLTPWIETDIESMMYGVNASAYLRSQFTLAADAPIDQVSLEVRYEDGFVAWLNGVEIARRNAPGSAGDPMALDAAALAERPYEEAILSETIFLDQAETLLNVGGDNVLAVQLLNASADDGDCLLDIRLVGRSVVSQSAVYFTVPTPGEPNDAESAVLGFVGRVEVDLPHGIYETPQTVNLNTDTPGAMIVYTTDGSIPAIDAGGAITNGTLYTDSLTVSGTTILRAAALAPGWVGSDTETRTYLFLADTIGQDGSPDGFPATWAGHTADYEVDPDVVTDTAYVDLLEEALTSIPSISLVMPVDDWFDPTTGIYSHPSMEGDLWERAVSAEWLLADGGEGFQIDAGIQMQGGTSVINWKSDKVSMRLVFKDEYGPTHLEYPLYADSPVEEFDTLVLDARLNQTWIHPDATQRERAEYIRDQFVSDMQDVMGQVGTHGVYTHVYINGVYWGVYDMHERPDEHFNADYFGGSTDDYNVIKHDNAVADSPVLVSGSMDDWNQALALANAGLASQAAYEQFSQLVDVENLIDYMILNIYAGNDDWPHKNWYFASNPSAGQGYQFFSWDAEHVLKNVSLDISDVGSGATENNPARLYYQLRQNAEFRMLLADRLQEHFSSGGALYVNPDSPAWDPEHPENNVPASVFNQRVAEIETAIIMESARWGDNRRPDEPYTRDVEWQAEIDNLNTNYFPQRSEIVLDQFRADGLFPTVDAPTMSQSGGVVDPGYELILTGDWSGTSIQVVYTTDGSDPRLVGGTINPSASIYSGPVSIDQSVEIRTRALVDGQWSPLVGGEFSLDPTVTAGYLAITEINYNPPNPTGDELAIDPALNNDDFEFIELFNTSDTYTIDLGGMAFTNGITYTFEPGTLLGPGQYLVLVRDTEAFALRYDTSAMQVVGPYGESDGGNKLSNDGETVCLTDPLGNPIARFRYNDGAAWPQLADGDGRSLEVVNTAGDYDLPETWYDSPQWGGSPGALAAAAVVDRLIFYYGSAWTAAGQDEAIATDKTALLPEQTAGPANWSNYEGGLNGLMIDVAHPTEDLDVGDFLFLFGNSDDPATWTAAAMPQITVRLGEGRGGSDRVVLTWDAEPVVNAWLQITVLAAPLETGLLADDVFYFGHFTGDVGNTSSPGWVTAADLTAIRNHPHGAANPASIDDRYDINRDTRVDAVDLILARNNVGSPLDSLRIIAPPLVLPTPAPSSAGGEPVVPMDWLDREELSVKRSSDTGTPLLIDLLLGGE